MPVCWEQNNRVTEARGKEEVKEGGRRRVWKVGGSSRQRLSVTQFPLTHQLTWDKIKQTEVDFPVGTKVKNFMKTIRNFNKWQRTLIIIIINIIINEEMLHTI